jgi:eukaryotic-like serine/threonine-protein kinase
MTGSARQKRLGGAGPGEGEASHPAEAASGDWSGLHSYVSNPTTQPQPPGGGEAPGPPAEEDDDPPRSALGKFHFLERIGKGGMGEVYLAMLSGPTGFSKLVVVKLLREDFEAYPTIRTMFLDEGRLASRLNHPNVVQTNEVGVEEGRHYLVMEYLEGQPLNQVIARARAAAVPLGLWVRIALDSLAGLDYAHELCDYDGTPLNVVHRDLSPHNIFLTYEGVVKLLDFGIAKAATQSAQTQVGTIKGKPAYMPPEQLMGLPVDRRADLYVFGIVLWEMFTGTRLFAGSLNECLKRIAGGPLPRVSSVVPGFDPGLDAVVARALERDPEARFQTARAMREALASAAWHLGAVPPQEIVGEVMHSFFRERREERRLSVQRYVSQRLRNPFAPGGASPPRQGSIPPMASAVTSPATAGPPLGLGGAPTVAASQTGATMSVAQSDLVSMPVGNAVWSAPPGAAGFPAAHPSAPGFPAAHPSAGFPVAPPPAGFSAPLPPAAGFSPAPPLGAGPALARPPKRTALWVGGAVGALSLGALLSVGLLVALKHKVGEQPARPAASLVDVASVNPPSAPAETPSAESAPPPAASAVASADPPAANPPADPPPARPGAAARHGRAPGKGREPPVETAAPPPAVPAAPPPSAAPPAKAPPRASQEPRRPPGRTFRTEL